MEITEKKYYCPKCFKQVNKQPGFDPLLSAWTCVNCGYEFKINHEENYPAEEVVPQGDSPVIDANDVEYDETTPEIEPVEEADVEIPIEEEHVEKPEIIEPEIVETEVVETEIVQPTEQNEEDQSQAEEAEYVPKQEEPAEQIIEPDTIAEQEEEASSDEPEIPVENSKAEDDIDFSSNAENEEVKQKKVGFFAKLFGDEEPREKPKGVLGFLKDPDEEEEIVEDDQSAPETERFINPEASYDQEINFQPEYENPDPFGMQSQQEELESEITEEPKKPGFMSSFFEKQEQKQAEKDVVRMQKDRERMEKAIDKRNYRRKKRRQWAMAHWKWILGGILVLLIVCFGGYKWMQYRKLTVVGIDAEQCVDKNYVGVVDEFANNGFTNVKTVPVEDLSMSDLEDEGQIISVSVDNNLAFTADDRYPYDAPVVIQYHSAAKVVSPISSREAKKMSYNEVIAKFKEAGFENIDTKAQEDLITGWLHSDGSVARITIGGNEKFNQGDAFRVDSKVIITYHTFPKDDKKEEKKEESKKEEDKKEESKTEDTKKEDSKEDTSKKEDTSSDSSKKDDSKTEKKSDK